MKTPPDDVSCADCQQHVPDARIDLFAACCSAEDCPARSIDLSEFLQNFQRNEGMQFNLYLGGKSMRSRKRADVAARRALRATTKTGLATETDEVIAALGMIRSKADH